MFIIILYLLATVSTPASEVLYIGSFPLKTMYITYPYHNLNQNNVVIEGGILQTQISNEYKI